MSLIELDNLKRSTMNIASSENIIRDTNRMEYNNGNNSDIKTENTDITAIDPLSMPDRERNTEAIFNAFEYQVFDIYSNDVYTKNKIPYLDLNSDEFQEKIQLKRENDKKLSTIAMNSSSNLTSTGNYTLKKEDENLTDSNSIRNGNSTNNNENDDSSDLNSQAYVSNYNHKMLQTPSGGSKSGSLTNADISHNYNHNTTSTGNSDKRLSPSLNSTKKQDFSSSDLKDGYDKWSPVVEDAFVASLRLIMKNGTSKIKIKDRNYGRNELISFYILYRTKEYRTKKQISSHIQVLKKAIMNKETNDIPLSETEMEVYKLIENGAEQTEENDLKFNEEFSKILESVDISALQKKKSKRSHKSFDYGNGHPTKKLHGNAYSSNQPNMLTPDSARFFATSGLTSPDPLTPLDYASYMYEKLPDYTCVPVKLDKENIYIPSLKPDYKLDEQFSSGHLNVSNALDRSHTEDGDNNNNGAYNNNNNNIKPINTALTHQMALDKANEIEMNQRRVIDSVNLKLKSSNDLNNISIDEINVSNNGNNFINSNDVNLNNDGYYKRSFVNDNNIQDQNKLLISDDNSNNHYNSIIQESNGIPQVMQVQSYPAFDYTSPVQSQYQQVNNRNIMSQYPNFNQSAQYQQDQQYFANLNFHNFPMLQQDEYGNYSVPNQMNTNNASISNGMNNNSNIQWFMSPQQKQHPHRMQYQSQFPPTAVQSNQSLNYNNSSTLQNNSQAYSLQNQMYSQTSQQFDTSYSMANRGKN